MENIPVKFRLTKRKIVGLLVFILILGTAGCLALYYSRFLELGSGRFILILIGMIMLFMTFFLLRAFYFLSKEKFTAMYISEEGLIDISTGNAIGTILWKDVEQIKVMDDIGNLKRKYIVLKVKNPTEYIHREINRGKRRTLELKLQYYGSPICFSERALNCSFVELYQAVNLKYTQYKKRKKSDKESDNEIVENSFTSSE